MLKTNSQAIYLAASKFSSFKVLISTNFRLFSLSHCSMEVLLLAESSSTLFKSVLLKATITGLFLKSGLIVL